MNEEFKGVDVEEETEQMGMGGGEDGMEPSGNYVHPYEPPEVESAWDEELDNEEEDKVYQASMPPGGYYIVENFKNARESNRETEFYVMNGEGYTLVKRPRLVTAYSGRGILERDGKTWTPNISIWVSPVRGYAKDGDGQVIPDKLDSPSKLFQHARVAYRRVLGDSPRTKREIDHYLRTHPFKVRTMQRVDGSLWVLGIEEIKPA